MATVIIHDVESAAAKFGVSRYSIRQSIDAGLLPVMRRPHKNCKYRFLESDFLKLFQPEK